MVPEPKTTYVKLGFSPLAVEMVLTVIRGQGAALLAIAVFLLFTGAHDARSFLFIAISAAFTLVTHSLTARHHSAVAPNSI